MTVQECLQEILKTMSREELAAAMGVRAETVDRWRKGRVKPRMRPVVDRIEALYAKARKAAEKQAD